MIKQYNPYLRIYVRFGLFLMSAFSCLDSLLAQQEWSEMTGGTQLLCQSELWVHTVKALCLTEGQEWQSWLIFSAGENTFAQQGLLPREEQNTLPCYAAWTLDEKYLGVKLQCLGYSDHFPNKTLGTLWL